LNGVRLGRESQVRSVCLSGGGGKRGESATSNCRRRKWMMQFGDADELPVMQLDRFNLSMHHMLGQLLPVLPEYGPSFALWHGNETGRSSK
jgi:hypothetical protein